MLIHKFVIIVLISEKEGEFKKYGIYNTVGRAVGLVLERTSTYLTFFKHGSKRVLARPW